jgi:hypothetical protein
VSCSQTSDHLSRTPDRDRARGEISRIASYNDFEASRCGAGDLEVILKIASVETIGRFEVIAGHTDDPQNIQTLADDLPSLFAADELSTDVLQVRHRRRGHVRRYLSGAARLPDDFGFGEPLAALQQNVEQNVCVELHPHFLYFFINSASKMAWHSASSGGVELVSSNPTRSSRDLATRGCEVS